MQAAPRFFILSVIFASSACLKKPQDNSDTMAAGGAKTEQVFRGYGTDFEKLGEPYGGCGVPESLLFDENGKKLPYIALNVQNTSIEEQVLPRPIKDASKVGLYNNGKNCGRWIEITVGNDCRNATQHAHEGKICVQADGRYGPEFYTTKDQMNGKVLYGVIADSCQDPNYWCRTSEEHIDISTHELLEMLTQWGGDRTLWNNREVSWKFIKQPPAKFQITAPKFAWAPRAMPYWPALIIYNLKNGLSKVEISVRGQWRPATMNSDMGQLWILGTKDNSNQSAQQSSYNYTFRISDSDNQVIGTYQVTLPAECENGCPDILPVTPRSI